MNRWLGRGTVGVLGLLVTVRVAAAQAPVGAENPVALPAIVGTADRGAWPLVGSVASVSRLTAEDFAHYPTMTVGEALRHVPGLAVVDFSGDGFAPLPIVRGFYGGGEAEYMVVLLNGRPVNDVQAGLVRWDAIPLAAIESIEVVRGGTSALYGDAALGAVLNIITRPAGPDSQPVVSLAGGSNDLVRGSAHLGTRFFGHDVGIFGGIDRSGGFREHAEREVGSAGIDYSLFRRNASYLKLSGIAHWRDVQEPGALLASDLDSNREGSSALHRFDRTNEANQRFGLDGEGRVAGILVTGSLTGENRDSELTRTIALAPGFGDTKQRVLNTKQVSAALQFTIDEGLLGDDRLTLGVETFRGTIDSKYYGVLTGGAADYEGSLGARGDLDVSGAGHRTGAALLAQYILMPFNSLRLSAGVRADWIEDSFSETEGEKLDAGHSAISPKVGINLRWLATSTQTGNFYATASRSFKAPTLDQLFDQRRIPFAPGMEITTSNPLLEPQRGVNLEAGLYHTALLIPGRLSAELALTGYQMDMENELDFDIATLRYVNIGESRHRGIEAALQLSGPNATNAFLNYTLQDVTDQVGEGRGLYLKGIPRHVIAAGVGVSPLRFLEAGLQATRTSGIYLDDENTVEHPAYTRLDARLGLALPDHFGGAGIFLDIRNVLDREYSTTGFPDPSGSGAFYYYPAAGRTLDIGIRLRN